MVLSDMAEIQLLNLTLYNFKNYESLNIELHPGINCFLGNNGSGKTNLLDAIHYLSNCKSYFNPVDSQNIIFGGDQFAITGEFLRNGQSEQIICSVRRNQRKIFKRNHKEYERLAEHIGHLPCVMITPYDIELIWDGSEVRRKFLDSTLAQLSRGYLEDLIAYNHALLQRNTVLKTYSKQAHFPDDFLEVWDVQLAERATRIHEARNSFLRDFQVVFQRVYREISGAAENVSFHYSSELNDATMEQLLRNNNRRDKMLERTSAGVHRDDLEFLMEGHILKKFASQGQQKSFLFALKFSQYLFIKESALVKPILLLDDFFDKIDEQRVANIMRWISANDVGQLFITDTSPIRMPEILNAANVSFKAWQTSGGKLEVV
jgi:DNA replication and repair protein RecF